MSECCCLCVIQAGFSFSRIGKFSGTTSDGRQTSLPLMVSGLEDKTVQINDPNSTISQANSINVEGSIPGADNQNPNWQIIATVTGPGFVLVPQSVQMIRIAASSTFQPDVGTGIGFIDATVSAQFMGYWKGPRPYTKQSCAPHICPPGK